MTIEQAAECVGRGVVYEPAHGAREDGTIVRVNDTYAFVLYAGDRTPKATHPRFLSLLGTGHVTDTPWPLTHDNAADLARVEETIAWLTERGEPVPKALARFHARLTGHARET